MEEPPAKAPPAPAVVAIAEPVPAPAAVPAPPDRTELWGSPGTMREAAASRLASLPRSDTAGREAGTLLASNTPSGAVPAGPAPAGGSPAAASAAGLTAPRLAFKQPRYPEAARQAGIEGTVLVKAYVLVDGSVKDAQVKRSGGYSALDRAALDTILESRFIPARRGGTPVAVWVEVPVDFKLSD
jgi:protein TonB